jgi:hypothetical protein
MNSWCYVDAALTLRDVSSGRGESTSIGAAVVALHPPNFQCGPGDFVILVHGYNVSQEKGRESYARFRWWLEHFETAAHVLELHWPGDRKWGNLSGLVYPWKIATAARCGVLFAEWLCQQHVGARFRLIGHSLGCRLILEAIKELRRRGRSEQVAAVCLLAAAVPVSYVGQNLLGPQSGDSTRWRVLYSRGDQILRCTFPIGEMAESMLPGAVGLTGEPRTRWTAAGDAWEMYQQTDTDSAPQFYKHGYYWQGGPKETVAEERCYWKRWLRDIEPPTANQGASAELVAGMLGGRVARPMPLRRLRPSATLPERFLPMVSAGPF